MKKLFIISTLFLFIFTGCEKDNEDIIDESSDSSEFPMEMSFSEFSNVSVDGAVKVNFVNENNQNRSSQSSQNSYSVTINATPDQRRNMDVYNDNGVLYIQAHDDID